MVKNEIQEPDLHQNEAGSPEMKATATVPPFLNFGGMRNHTQEQHPLASPAPTSGEGGFAAALRKLAQQAPGGMPAHMLPRDVLHSPTGKHLKGIQYFLLSFSNILVKSSWF